MASDLEREGGDHRPPEGPRSPTLLHTMRRSSIRLLLSAASVLFLLEVLALGIFSIQRLSDLNRVSEEIRSRWLQDTRLLGDLNNYMSDYRTGEATYLLSHTGLEFAASQREIQQLDSRVTRAQRGYEALAHDPSEQALYTRFAREWDAYKSLAHQVLAVLQAGQPAAATTLYMTGSRRAFDQASDTLTALTDETVARAREAGQRADGAYEHDRRLILIGMVLAACLLVAMIIYISRFVSAPLLRLSRRMHSLAGHDTDLQIPHLGRDDEIGEIARSVAVFRDTAIMLRKSQQRLLEQAAVLESTLEKERSLNARQRNFLTLTSHEFRTPLTVIDAQAQRLIKLREQLSSEDVLERAGRIRGAVRRLTAIMESLLTSSRLFDGELAFQPVMIDPAELLRDVCQLHRDTSPGAVIIEQFTELPMRASADSRLLFAAFGNLVSNAIKYSPVGRPIHVYARGLGPGEWCVTVQDEGIGICDKDRAHLFERYFRGTNASKIPGSGVGLHLVSLVISLHGGGIEVVSREREGSAFTVRLPTRALTASVDVLPAEASLTETECRDR